jgi:hypothetical protein
MIFVNRVQDGNLFFRSTSLGEYGFVVGNDKKLTDSIYWNSKKEMVEALEKTLKAIKEES